MVSSEYGKDKRRKICKKTNRMLCTREGGRTVGSGRVVTIIE